MTERALAVTIYPLRLRFAQTPLPTGEARGRLSESAPRIKRYSRPVFWDESSSCFVVPPKFGNSLGISLTCAGKRAARPGDFGAMHLIRLLGGRPSRGCCKSLSAKRLSLWAARHPVLLPRRRSLSDRFFVFHHDTPIQIAALQSEDQHFGRGQIGRAGDVVRIAQAERAHDALILPRVGVVRV